MQPFEPAYKSYVTILQEELIPATGCTEPIAIAYVAAVARETLGSGLPESSTLEACGNIIKNVRSVVVPNTGGRKGIETAVAAGFLSGDPDKVLEVLSSATEEQKAQIDPYLLAHPVQVVPARTDKTFYLKLTIRGRGDTVSVTLEDYHTNITRIEKNGAIVFEKAAQTLEADADPKRKLLNVKDIVDFADTVKIDEVRAVITRQIQFNTAIAQEGLTGRWGAQIGRILMENAGDDTGTRAKALAAAGSDARMSGCEMPVIIVSGSGNQGMTASLPVISYGESIHCCRERLIRALVVSNLVTIHQKTEIGRLSAFCGAVSAGCGAAAGIAYLHGGDFDVIAHTIVNTLAIASGMVCDGAKPSCAAKIAVAVDAGLLGYRMYLHGQQFRDGEGIVVKGVDNTIHNVGRMAHEGMRDTDREIIEMMTEKRRMP